MFAELQVNIVKYSAQGPTPKSLIWLTNSIQRTLAAISDKPKVFGSLLPDILNSDHFRVSFESVELGKCPHGACLNNNFRINDYLTNQVKFSVISWTRHSSGLHIKSTFLNSKQVGQK